MQRLSPASFPIRVGSLAALLITITGCKSQPAAPQTLAPAALQVSLRQYPGTTLTGPQAKAPADDVLSSAWDVTADIVAVKQLPGDPFRPIGPEARLVLGTQPGNVLSPSTTLVHSTRYQQIKTTDTLDAILQQPSAEISKLGGAVAIGTTASFELELPGDTPVKNPFSRRKIAVAVYRDAKSPDYELSLVSQDLASGAKTTSDVNAETVVLHRSIAGDADRVLISVPMALPDSTAAGVVIDLTINTKTPDAATLTAMTIDIAASAQEAAGRINRVNLSPDDIALTVALDAALDAPPVDPKAKGHSTTSLRPVLSYLAEQADAKLSDTVILVADDNVLQLIQTAIRDQASKLPARDKKTIAWMLDRATVSVIASIKEEQTPGVLPPIIGALTIYAGDVGRQLDLLQSLTNQSVSSDDLYARIIAEQQIALEDNSPAVRVRAYDWLAERGAAPADYDPLAPGHARRDALEKYHDVQATQPSIAK